MAKQMLNVNTNSNIILTAKLERLNKQAFPNAVRSTLNDAAFVSKKTNILESAKRNMTVRNPSFFRKFTGVNRAQGWDVKTMQSEVGFVNTDPNKIKGKKAIEGMEHNEVGGSDAEGAMYLPKSRISGNSKRLVKKGMRFAKGKIASGTSSKMRTKKLNFVANAYASAKEKKPTFIETSKGRFLVQVTRFDTDHKKLNIKMDFLMRSRRKNVAHAKATHFNLEAALKTQKQIEVFYAKNADYQFNKVLRGTR